VEFDWIALQIQRLFHPESIFDVSVVEHWRELHLWVARYRLADENSLTTSSPHHFTTPAPNHREAVIAIFCEKSRKRAAFDLTLL
jgi:hypothetical protein